LVPALSLGDRRMTGMSSTSLRIAAICLHTSPLEAPGGADAGGMNVVVLEQSLALARLGHRVDLFTRRSDPSAPAIVEVADGVRLLHLDAGPAAPLAKSDMEQAIRPFRAALSAHLHDAAATEPYEIGRASCRGRVERLRGT